MAGSNSPRKICYMFFIGKTGSKRHMASATILDPHERTRRSEFMREVRTATLSGESTECRARNREKKIADWSRWFREQMDTANCADPTAILPEAFSRLEQLAEDHTAAAVREIKATLTRALK
jgi:hypothetical protein